MRLTQLSLTKASQWQVKQALAMQACSLSLQPPPPFLQEPDWGDECPEWIIPLHRHVPPDLDAGGSQRQDACERMPGGSGLRSEPIVDRAREDRLNYAAARGGRAMYSLDPPRRWTTKPQGPDMIETPIGRIYLKTCAKRPTWDHGYLSMSRKHMTYAGPGDIVLLAWVRPPWVSFMYWAYWEQFCWTKKTQDWSMNPDQMLHVPVRRARPIVELVALLAQEGWHLTPQQIDIPWEELL